jgi:hypothetical protein
MPTACKPVVVLIDGQALVMRGVMLSRREQWGHFRVLQPRGLATQTEPPRSGLLSGCKTDIKGVIAKRAARSEGQTPSTAASGVAYVARPSSAGL